MKTLLAAVVMLVATSASVLLTPPIDLAAGHGILRGVPHEFGPWQGTDAQFEQAVVEELRADDLLIRRYVDGTRSVWLCLVYHQNRRYGAHDPLLCYTSQGYAVRQPGRARVDDGSPKGLIVNTCIAERRDDSRVVWYWWTTDGPDRRRRRLPLAHGGAGRARQPLVGHVRARRVGAARGRCRGRDAARAGVLGTRGARAARGVRAGARGSPAVP